MLRNKTPLQTKGKSSPLTGQMCTHKQEAKLRNEKHQRVCILHSFRLAFSRSLCLYLSHYSVHVALFTLQRNCNSVYLSRSDAPPNSFTFSRLFVFFEQELHSHHFLLHFFFLILFCFINFYHKSGTSNLYSQGSSTLKVTAVMSPPGVFLLGCSVDAG